MRRVFVTSCALAVVCQLGAPSAQTTSPTLIESSRQLLRDLVGINTAEPDGNTTIAATRVAEFLKSAGFPAEDVQVIGADPRRGNLVARLRGRGTGKPVLFLAHLDVVPAMREDWTTDPYALVEKDGYFYGRGTIDDKQFCATLAAAFAQLKREGFVPDRDLVLALTTGEEQGTDETANGVMWLLKHHRPLVDAAYVDQRRRRWRRHRARWPLHRLRRAGRREALCRLHARGDPRRRPQLAPCEGQSHLPHRSRAVAHRDAGAAVEGGRGDPAVPRVSRDRRVGPEGRRSSRGRGNAAGPGRAWRGLPTRIRA